MQTHKRPVTEYRVIREKAAAQKRDVERALTRFVAKTSDTEKLFEDDPYAFPREYCGLPLQVFSLHPRVLHPNFPL